MASIDEYLENVTPAQKAEFERVSRIIKQVVPDAEGMVSYGIPAFKYRGKPLIYFGAFKDHMSVFPASDSMIEAIEGLGAFRTSKGTLQFTHDKPISDAMLKKIVQHRLNDIQLNGAQAYRQKTKSPE